MTQSPQIPESMPSEATVADPSLIAPPGAPNDDSLIEPAGAAEAAISDEELVDELVAGGQSDTFTPPADMPRWMGCTIACIDAFSRRVGYLVAWLIVPIFVTMVYEIIARKFFTAPTLWAYDVSRMLYGSLFMLGAAYGLLRGIHIRADFMYRTLPARLQAGIDGLLYLILFFPSMFLFLYVASEYAYEAWERGEIMDDTAFRPAAWPIRAVMAVSILFLIIQGVSETLKTAYTVWRGRWPNE